VCVCVCVCAAQAYGAWAEAQHARGRSFEVPYLGRVLIGGGGVAATFVGSARALAKHGLTQPLRRIVLSLAAPTAAGGGERPALLRRRPVLCALAPEPVWQWRGAAPAQAALARMATSCHWLEIMGLIIIRTD
jgi:hypothetical protein